MLLFFFFNDTATTEIYTLSLHDALPISPCTGSSTIFTRGPVPVGARPAILLSACLYTQQPSLALRRIDRKSTRLNSSHLVISYAVFCLKKKNDKANRQSPPLTAHYTPAH